MRDHLVAVFGIVVVSAVAGYALAFAVRTIANSKRQNFGVPAQPEEPTTPPAE
jgi:hypothetical protein